MFSADPKIRKACFFSLLQRLRGDSLPCQGSDQTYRREPPGKQVKISRCSVFEVRDKILRGENPLPDLLNRVGLDARLEPARWARWLWPSSSWATWSRGTW